MRVSPYNQVSGVLSGASVLLLLTNTGRKGILTTKLFEYLAVGRPVLCVSAAAADDIPQILRRTGSGLGTCSLQEAKRFILRLYREWRDNGIVSLASEQNVIAEFSRKAQAKRLASLLAEVAGSTCRVGIA